MGGVYDSTFLFFQSVIIIGYFRFIKEAHPPSMYRGMVDAWQMAVHSNRKHIIFTVRYVKLTRTPDDLGPTMVRCGQKQTALGFLQ